MQLIRRRSLKKVDSELLTLGGLFIATGLMYVLFELIKVNYRPIIMPGDTAAEASFPSSHTMLIMTVMIAVMIVSDKYFGNLFGAFIRVLCFLTTLVTVGGRLWCGVHWLTDIIGGILLSATLLFLFAAVVSGSGREKVDPDLEFDYDNKQAVRRRNTVEKTDNYKPKH